MVVARCTPGRPNPRIALRLGPTSQSFPVALKLLMTNSTPTTIRQPNRERGRTRKDKQIEPVIQRPRGRTRIEQQRKHVFTHVEEQTQSIFIVSLTGALKLLFCSFRCSSYIYICYLNRWTLQCLYKKKGYCLKLARQRLRSL